MVPLISLMCHTILMNKLNFIIFFQILFFGAASAMDCQCQFLGIVRAKKGEGYFLVMNEKSNSEVKFKIAQSDIIIFSVYLNKYVSGKTQVNKQREVYRPVELANAVPDPLQISSAVNFKKVSLEKCDN